MVADQWNRFVFIGGFQVFSFIHKLTKPQRTLLFTCFYAFFCNGTLSLVMGSAMPDIKLAYGLSDTVSGVLLSAHSIGNWAAGFLYGVFALAFGQKKSVIFMDAMALAGFIMVMLFGNPVCLFFAFVCLGVGRGSVANFNNATVNRLSGGSPAAANLLHASFAVGAILTPMVFLVLSRAFSWRAGVGYAAACVALCLALLHRVRIEEDAGGKTAPTNRSVAFLKNPSYLILAAMMFFYLCSEYAINGWLVTYIQNKSELLSGFHASGDALDDAVKAYSQTMATLLWAIILVGRLICASLSAKISQKILMMVSSFGVAVFFAVMLMSASIPMVTFAVAGLGLCLAGICPMIYSDCAPFTNTYVLATSVLLAIGSAGGILMPAVVGALADRFGFTGGMRAILVSVALLAVCSVLNVVLKNRAPAGNSTEELNLGGERS